MVRYEFWVISTLLSIGMIGGFIYNWPDVSQSADAPAVESIDIPDSTENLELGPRETPDNINRIIDRGDNYLNVGNGLEAQEYYKYVHDFIKDDLRILFRLGLVAEYLGDFKKAENYYQTLQRQSNVNNKRRLLIELAITRCWLQSGRSKDAIESLCHSVLNSEEQDGIDSDIRFQQQLQLAESLQYETVSIWDSLLPTLDSPLLEYCGADIETILDQFDAAFLIENESPAAGDESTDDNVVLKTRTVAVDPPKRDIITLLQNPSPDANLKIIQCYTPTVSVIELLKMLESVTELKFEYGPRIQPYLIGRTTKIQTQAITVGVLLDNLLFPFDLTWQQDGNRVALVEAADLEAVELAKFRTAQSIRIGRQIIVNYPEAKCRDAIRFANATFDFLLGNIEVSTTELKQLIDERVGGELKAKVHLSLAFIEKNLGRSDESIEHYYAAVDQSLEAETKAIGYANVGRLQLNASHISPAIVSCGRSLSLAKNDKIRVEAALDIARAYLLDQSPASANRAIFEHRKAFADGAQKRLSIAFTAYARSQGSLNIVAREKAIETLVLALADIDTNQLDSSIDRVLIARAFKSINLPGRAIDTLKQSTDKNSKNGVWDRRVDFELAHLYKDTVELEKASKLFKSLTFENDEIGRDSMLELAKSALFHEDDPALCIEYCKKIWSDSIEQKTKIKLLKLMGNAYRKLGDNQAAVYCYYGVLPDSNETQDRQPPAVQ